MRTAGFIFADEKLDTGTPPAAGTYVFNTIASNLSGQTVQPVALTVNGGSSSVPTITGSTVASGSVGNPFTYHIATSPAANSYTALALPTGLLFNEPTGTILGTPNTTGFFQIPITATNAAGSYASVLSLTIAPPSAPQIATSLVALAGGGNAFTHTIPATGVVSTYAETGALTAGLSFNSTTGVISGTPTATGNFPLNVTVSNDTGMNASTLTLKVLTTTNYSGWSTTNGVIGGPNGTPYHDGVPNLLKFLYDINPSSTISPTDRSALPVIGTTTIGGTQYFTLTYRKFALESGVTVIVQTSTDLKTWTTDTTPADQAQPTGTVDSVTGDSFMTVQVPMTASKQFIRLQVTMP